MGKVLAFERAAVKKKKKKKKKQDLKLYYCPRKKLGKKLLDIGLVNDFI